MRANTKILALAFAAAVLAGWLAQATSIPSADRVDDSEVAKPIQTSASNSSKRPPPIPPARSFTSAEPSDGTGGASGSGAQVPTRSSQLPGEEDYEDASEDPSIYTSEPSQQFRQWRQTLIDEVPDRAWADQLRGELARRIEARPHSVTTFHQVDCRETICRLYLQTNDALAARAIMTIAGESPLQIERQQLAAHVRLEDAPKEGITYELLIRRDRPSWMPPHVPGAGPAYFQTLASGE